MENEPESSAVGTGMSSPPRMRLYASPLNLFSRKPTHQQHRTLSPVLRQTSHPDRNQFTELPSSYPGILLVDAGRPSAERESTSPSSSDSIAKFSDEDLRASRTDMPTNVYEYPSSLSISSSESGDYTLPVKQRSADLQPSGMRSRKSLNIPSHFKVIRQPSNEKILEDSIYVAPNKPPLSIPQNLAFEIKSEDHITTKSISNDLMNVKLRNGTLRRIPPKNFGFMRLFKAKHLGSKLDLKNQTQEKHLKERNEGNILNMNKRNEVQQKEVSKLVPTFPTTLNDTFLQRRGHAQENLRRKRSGGSRWVWGTPGRSTTTAPQLTTAVRLDTQVADAFPDNVPERHFPVSYDGDQNFDHHPQHVLASPGEEYNSDEDKDSPFLQDTDASFTSEPNYNRMPSNRDAIDRDYSHVYHPTSSYSYIQPEHQNYHSEPVDYNYHSHPNDHNYHNQPQGYNYHRKEKPHHPIETKFSLTFPVNKTMSFRWFKALTMNASFTDIHNPFKPFLQFGFSSGMEPVYHPHTGYETHHGHHTSQYKRQMDISSDDTPGDRYVSEDSQDSSFDIFNFLPKIGLSFARGKEKAASAFDPLGIIMQGWDSLKNFFGASDETGEEKSETAYVPEYVSTAENYGQPSETYILSEEVHDPYISTYEPHTRKPSLRFYETSAEDQSHIHIGKYTPPVIYIPAEEMYDSSSATFFQSKEAYTQAYTPTTGTHTTHTNAYAVTEGTPFPSAGMNTQPRD